MNNNIKKNWVIMDKLDKSVFRKSEYNNIILQLLHNRGITDKNDIENFFSDDYDQFENDPFLFNDMEESLDLLISHIKNKNKILVYGDYDADGVSSSALMVEIIQVLRGDVDVYLPDRAKEGYGLNMDAVLSKTDNNYKLIITVDNGIRSKKEIDKAKSKGIDVIVTDHHTPPEENDDLPTSLLLDPLVEGEKYPFKKLAGVGVAYKLAKGLISKSKLNDEEKSLLEQRVVDLVAIGTVADCVPLIGENRLLVKKGLERLNAKNRVGIKELIKVAKINSEIKSWNIGFQIAPRINAAGRMEHANTAYNLLTTTDSFQARRLASELNKRNMERQNITEEIFLLVEKQINKEDNILIGVCPIDEEDEDVIWNEGVVGLVSGRITDKYYRPSLVITKTHVGYKGSGRSIPELNLIEAIQECSDFLDRYGGHPAACGFSLKPENLDNFTTKLKKIVDKKLKGIDLVPRISIDAEIKLEEISQDLIDNLNKFEPFGQGNEKPTFVSRGIKVLDIIYMGVNGQHIKLKLKSSDSSVITAIGFNQSDNLKSLRVNDVVDMVYYLDENDFNGKHEVQAKIIDLNIKKYNN